MPWGLAELGGRLNYDASDANLFYSQLVLHRKNILVSAEKKVATLNISACANLIQSVKRTVYSNKTHRKRRLSKC